MKAKQKKETLQPLFALCSTVENRQRQVKALNIYGGRLQHMNLVHAYRSLEDKINYYTKHEKLFCMLTTEELNQFTIYLVDKNKELNMAISNLRLACGLPRYIRV